MTDIIEKLEDLHRQSTEEHSHFYVGKVVKEAIAMLKCYEDGNEPYEMADDCHEVWELYL